MRHKYLFLLMFFSYGASCEPGVSIVKHPFITGEPIQADEVGSVDSVIIGKMKESVIGAEAYDDQPQHISVSKKAVIDPQPLASGHQPEYSLIIGESYRNAISRWLWSDGIELIAWDASLGAHLDKIVESSQSIVASNPVDAVNVVPLHSENRLQFSKFVLPSGQVAAAIHSFSNPHVYYVEGKTLKQVVASLANDYGWHFSSDSGWFVTDDFQFSGAYPIVTETGDIQSALVQVLDGFPVRAQILHSTKEVYIVEERENDE